MSLVNKMLRDLDARRAGAGELAAMPAAVTPLAARQEPGRSLAWLWLGTVLVAGLAVVAWYGAQFRDAPAPAAFPVVSAPAAPPVPAVVPAPDPVVATVPAPVASAVQPSLRMADELSAVPAGSPRKAPVPAPKLLERPAASSPPPPPLLALPKQLPLPAEASIDKQVRLPSAAERAEIAYRRGIQAQRQGNAEAAAGSYRAALEDFAEHAAARQSLAALLIDAKRFDEAEDLLLKGTQLPSLRLASTLAWARLKVERNQAPAALELLLKNAAAGEHSAEYQGFAGALLNRAGRAAEAIERYQAATRLAPSEGRWWAGLGIAFEAAGRSAEAREAYLKARALPGLPADLGQHIEQRLR